MEFLDFHSGLKKNRVFFHLSKKIDFAGVLNLLSPFHFSNCADHLESFLNLLDLCSANFWGNFAYGIWHVAPTKVASQDQVKAAAQDHTWLVEPLKELVPSLG